MSARTNSAFDVAFYFINKAKAEKLYLQPQKLQSLLFLSQAYFLDVTKGQLLMPAAFVADERGPLEPNIYAAFSNDLPIMDKRINLPKVVEGFLDTIWRRFGHMSTDKLIEIAKDNNAYKTAKNSGLRAQISFEDIRFSFNLVNLRTDNTIEPKSNLYRNQSGKAVNVEKWKPRKKIGRPSLD